MLGKVEGILVTRKIVNGDTFLLRRVTFCSGEENLSSGAERGDDWALCGILVEVNGPFMTS